MARFDDLLEKVEAYQALVTENYDRIRKLAEGLSAGMCEFMDSKTGTCVHLVPRFRQLGPVAFGLAVRVSKGTDWLRVTMECHKLGDKFTIHILEGEKFTLELPLTPEATEPFYQHVYDHVYNWFEERIQRYENGRDYDTREIGFDFSDDDEKALV